MKITNITPYVVLPNSSFHERVQRYWTFVRVDTDEGIYGWGAATSTNGGGSELIGHTIEQIKELIIGEDPNNIEHIWHKIFHQYTYLGSRGLPTVVISGIDIALWDIKGKVLNRPIYDLLGGKVRENIPLYANGWFVGSKTPETHAEAAQKTIATGHKALKLDPFRAGWGDLSGQLPKEIENEGCNFVRAVRNAVGPDIDILIDAHGHYNVPTATHLANRLFDESQIGWFEEPVPPEGVDSLRQVKEAVRSPICVGERLRTRWDFLPIFHNNLADYVMPDIIWTGGIS